MKKLRLMLGVGLSITTIVSYSLEKDNENSDLIQPLDWHIVRTNKTKGITTYYKQEIDKRYRSFKVDAIYNNSFDLTACHLLNPEKFKGWFTNTTESRLLKKISDTEYFMYLRLKLMQNVSENIAERDIPLHVVITPYTTQNKELVITYSAIPDYMPTTAGVIRMPVYHVITRLMPLDNGRTHELTEGYAEPGGNAPTWLVNYMQRRMPYANSLALSDDIDQSPSVCLFKYKE